MTPQLKRLTRSHLLRNAAALYGIRLANQLLPLIVIPYLARVLGPQGWGLLAFAQAFALFALVVVEYGFEFAGTRAVARERGSALRLSELVTGIVSTQLLLVGLVALAGLAVPLAVPAFRDEPALLWAALAFAALQGLNPLWYFTGRERLPPIALLDMTGRLIATLLIFLFVREPGDGWMVLGFHALAASILSAGGCALVLREVTPARPSLRLVGQTLRLGFTMFLMRLAVMVNTAGNAFLLGLLVAPQHVAFFVAGEKLCRTSSWLLQPINIVLLPRIAHLLGERPEQARRLASLGLVAMAGIGLSFAVAIGIAAPVIVDLLFGERYAAAVPVTRVMALIVPLIVVNTCLVSYWLVPRGLDRGLNLVLISAAILNVGLVLLVAPLSQALGVAWVTFAVEGFILIGFLVILRRRGLRPLDAGILRDLAARVLGRGRAVSAD